MPQVVEISPYVRPWNKPSCAVDPMVTYDSVTEGIKVSSAIALAFLPGLLPPSY